MSDFNVIIPMKVECCFECGIFFAVPKLYVESQIEDGNDVYCPNGHINQYARPDELQGPTATEQKLRADLMAALHRAEQAEARASEANGVKVGDALTSNEAADSNDPPAVLRASAQNPAARVCIVCGRAYASPAWLRRHLLNAHNINISKLAIEREWCRTAKEPQQPEPRREAA